MEKNNYSKILFVLIVFIGLVSCKKNDTEVDLYHDYFPLEEGLFMEYDVTYINHNPKSDTFEYRLKVVVGDTTIDNSGRIAHKIFRYIYDTLADSYKPKDLWTAIIFENRAELVEENKNMIKMVFAPTADKTWDVNAFNNYEPMFAKFENIHDSYSTNGFNFDQTVKVLLEYKEHNMIKYINNYEIYAKGVGLVEKHLINIDYEDFDSSDPTNGEELYYKLIKYGKE